MLKKRRKIRSDIKNIPPPEAVTIPPSFTEHIITERTWRSYCKKCDWTVVTEDIAYTESHEHLKHCLGPIISYWQSEPKHRIMYMRTK